MSAATTEMATTAGETYSPRQNAVLESALALLVEGGERALTTAGVARAANCSKESLYKWFGDRDGLLAAMITFQSSQVRAEPQSSGAVGRAALRAQLIGIGANLLRVLAGDMSLALNRLAIGQARRDEAKLGRLLREHGRKPIETRLSALLEAGRAAGLIAFDDTREAYRTLYGLVVRDMHVRLLLGDGLDDQSPAARAEQAIDQFLRLYGAERTTGLSPEGRHGTGPAPERAGAGNERTG
ncbi:TetR/AcrR family transcriptional regulator C-terminal domain-containing protein [Kaistia dalseonensis]|uniref:AcrR family transcriptional regulator n=1 Tax=Kaistia dalseonensis TaxID=410840 RepID=A0ABU0HCY9_9HYPH|nr:TetR/AcrR family transcriptional regulator C-terminal domain-containing protein [Kaistia dalseonensis]MCX5497082.1 TetR/AcrR family transcriptional regulator C-terminal domain-containing protein [Kaistia dalseonensis]MDQ0439708.1 AcrR family transcriptional regulator [Kaistia dalseonensis]